MENHRPAPKVQPHGDKLVKRVKVEVIEDPFAALAGMEEDEFERQAADFKQWEKQFGF